MHGKKGLARISDLRQHPELRLGLSQEFLGRADGWPNLERAYKLRFPPPKGLDHGLAYEAIAGGQVDVIDIYTTDAKLDKYQLTVLEDDLKLLPALRRRSAPPRGRTDAVSQGVGDARASSRASSTTRQCDV